MEEFNDPAPGLYSLEIDPKNAQLVIKWNRTTEYWATGSYIGRTFSSVPEMSINYMYNFSFIDNENESYFTYSLYNSTIPSRMIMDVWGQIQQLTWMDGISSSWILFWFQPIELCQIYAKCGAFGVCDHKANATCNCLSGFKPKSDRQWHSNDYSGGCVRDKRSACFSTCFCTAYTYDGSGNCSIWTGDLFNLQRFSKNEIERTIFIKRGSPEGHSQSDRSKGTQGAHISHWHKAEGEAKVLMNENSDEVVDVPYFHLETILAATDNFSNANKLGQGGFGPVYKGIFPGEKEIAVKTLSSQSGQGIDEFKNEVTLTAKLQHRNLGIGRGLSYLHHDSRLRIIHRDLKTSNILLDKEMNPKISDFGLARIVEGKVTEANTKKVVGTYGYMSPEYALDGLFSIKSDVFSFGVVVLEIISGRRNTGFYQSEEALNLLGYAWKLWTEKTEIQLIEKSLLESCNRSEAIKCIHVALLCVQENPNHRPNMSDVIVMLRGEAINLPTPNRPVFVTRTHTSITSSSSPDKNYIVSNNQMTITVEEGR
ncbi:hypothetical protein H5410_035622 [Solanum commersonii]|uniref:non-specific serine/threonine protein kinase n=1 Tax=Solanum commersonii TaxID=4109 RepID=A0A9J5Y5P8_SOLCO|nr:hypothetical protein H5410_035622 [Solanum commersonii]